MRRNSEPVKCTIACVRACSAHPPRGARARSRVFSLSLSSSPPPDLRCTVGGVQQLVSSIEVTLPLSKPLA